MHTYPGKNKAAEWQTHLGCITPNIFLVPRSGFNYFRESVIFIWRDILACEFYHINFTEIISNSEQEE